MKNKLIITAWLGFWFAAGLVAGYFLIGGQA